MVPAYLADAKFWRLLLRFDEDVAAQVRAFGCPLCGSVLHSARYRRKPRGAPRAVLGEAYERRLSLCCAREGCRRRTTPVSVRFFGRRVYLAALVVLALYMTGDIRMRYRSVTPGAGFICCARPDWIISLKAVSKGCLIDSGKKSDTVFPMIRSTEIPFIPSSAY